MESSPPQTQPSSPPPPPYALPKQSDLSSHAKQFLDQHLGTHQDLLLRAPLLSDLTAKCLDLDTHLSSLRRSLTKRTVSWISRSLGAKSSIATLNFMLEKLSLYTSQCGIGSRRMHRVLVEELPRLAKHLRQIEYFREYFDAALQLEALVGDLEDTVFSVGLCNESMLSTKRFASLISMDFRRKHERFLQVIKVMNDVEEVLVTIVVCQHKWRHLLESVDARVNKTLAVVRPQILADHRAVLASLGWPPRLFTSTIDGGEVVGLPNPLVLMEGDKKKYYSQTFLALCALQHLQARRESRQHSIVGRKKYDLELWAFDELVHPISSRIEYHLSKWSEQPEFMFALVHKITRDFIVGVDDVLQPLIDRARLGSYSAKEAWVSAMVRMLSGFLAKKVFPILAERYKERDKRLEVASSWLHLIDHMVAFDKKMLSLLSSETCFFLEDSERVEGLSSSLSVLMLFCDSPYWLKIWEKVELKDAWKKLKPELKNERAWLVDKKSGDELQTRTESIQFFLSTREDYKAPLIAESVLKTAWEMIERCGTLPAVRQRVQFVRATSAKFLWHFLNVLVFHCKNAKLSLDHLDDALVKVCGSINAARYIESKLQEWSDDVNFLDMRSAENSFEKHETSGCDDNGCFFDEEIKSLAELMTNWLMEIITFLLHKFETLSWDYLQNNSHFDPDDLNVSGVPADMDLAVSADIIPSLDTLQSQLHLLETSLNPKDFLDLWRSVADGLDHFISSSILATGAELSSKGITQFGIDMEALFTVFRPFCARPRAFFPSITETLKLLNMSREEGNHLLVALSSDGNGTRCLPLYGISHLSFHQVVKVLKNAEFRSLS